MPVPRRSISVIVATAVAVVVTGCGGPQLPDFVTQRFEFGFGLFAAPRTRRNKNGRRQKQDDELGRDQNHNMV